MLKSIDAESPIVFFGQSESKRARMKRYVPV